MPNRSFSAGAARFSVTVSCGFLLALLLPLAPGKAAAILHKPFGDEQLLAALHRVTKGAT